VRKQFSYSEPPEFGRGRLVVRTLPCGYKNPSAIPGHRKFLRGSLMDFHFCNELSYKFHIDFLNMNKYSSPIWVHSPDYHMPNNKSI
jgi:hypothetical protein